MQRYWLLHGTPLSCSVMLFLSKPCLLLLKNNIQSFPDGSEGKASACNAGGLGWSPGWGRSPGEGNGNPLQYSCLENPMDGEAWWATVHAVSCKESDTTKWLHFLSLSNMVLLLFEKETNDKRPELSLEFRYLKMGGFLNLSKWISLPWRMPVSSPAVPFVAGSQPLSQT